MLMTAADFTRRFFSSDSSFDSLLPVLLWEKSGWGERAQVNTGSLAIQNELCHCFPCCRCIEDAPTAVACNWPAQVRLLTAYPPPACPPIHMPGAKQVQEALCGYTIDGHAAGGNVGVGPNLDQFKCHNMAVAMN